MMNAFYFDCINLSIEAIEKSVQSLPYTDAKKCMDALAEIRSISDTVHDQSSHTKHIWNENSYVLGPDWETHAGNPQHSYVDVWAARYELIRREIVRKLESGFTIEMVPPPDELPELTS